MRRLNIRNPLDGFSCLQQGRPASRTTRGLVLNLTLALAFTLTWSAAFPGSAWAMKGKMKGKISAGEVPEVGVQEKLGTTPPLQLPFADENGSPITLQELVDRPTILLFVYYRCPSICDPMMRELARALDQIPDQMGKDYRVVTISFDPEETPKVASIKKEEILQTMSNNPFPEGWRFLTGKEENIKKMTEAAGFSYRYDEKTQSYVHASSLIFLSPKGKIVRYMGGLSFLPTQVKMALYDASTGHERSFMKTVERMCYSYDPQGRKYVFQLNRIILGVSGVFVVVFLAFLFLVRPKKTKNGGADAEPASQEATAQDTAAAQDTPQKTDTTTPSDKKEDAS